MSLSRHFAALAATLVVSSAAQAATITPNTFADDLDTNANCTLREAIQAANTDTAVDGCPAGSGADTIVLAAGTYLVTLGQPGDEDANTGDDLDISSEVTLEGAGADKTTVQYGLPAGNVFEATGAEPATFVGLTITGGASLTNAASDGVFSANAPLSFVACRLTGNTTGVMTDAPLKMDRCLVDANGAMGIWLPSGTLSLRNTTLSGNQEAIHFDVGAVSLSQCTLSGNSVAVVSMAGPSSLTLRGTLVAGNQRALDGQGVVPTSLGNNLSDDEGFYLKGPGDKNMSDAGLTSLANNGGPTFTFGLQATSSAVDSGSCLDVDGKPVTVDQRGMKRPAQGCDVGAFELVVPAPRIATTSEPAGKNCPTGGTRIDAGIDTDGDDVPDSKVTTSYVCNGADGKAGKSGQDGDHGRAAVARVTAEPAGKNCAAGGQKIEVGVDDGASPGDGVLDDDEVDQTQYVCNGAAGAKGADGAAGAAGADGKGCTAAPGGPFALLALLGILPLRRRRQ